MRYHVICLISFMLFGTCGILNGQTKTNEIGIEGGPGLSIIHAKTGMYSHSGFSVGGITGGFYQYNFNRLFSLKLALEYERKGSQLESKSDLFPPGDFIYTFDYLSLPVLFKVSAGKKIKMFANAGPCFSYLINQTLFFKPKSGNIVKQGNETNSYKQYDLGILLGIGLFVPISERYMISFEIRENYGMMSLRDNYNEPDSFGYFESDSGPKFKSYANSTTLLLGFTYRFRNNR